MLHVQGVYVHMYICVCMYAYMFTLNSWLVYISDVMVFLIASPYQKSKQAELRRQHMKIVRTPYALETLPPRSPHYACTNTTCPEQTPTTKLKGLTSTEERIVPTDMQVYVTTLTVKD